MKPDQLQLGFLKVLKGSPIYYDREKFAIVYQDRAPYEVLFTDWVSYMDVLKLKRVEDMTERYYNSMQFEASLPYIISFFDTPFDFFMQEIFIKRWDMKEYTSQDFKITRYC